MTKFLTAVALLCVFTTAGAVRVLEQAEKPVELALSDLTLPTDNVGNLVFKECNTCRTKTHRVTAATKYFLNRRELALTDIRLAVEELRASRNAAAAINVAVFLDLNTEQVTRVSIQRPGL
jgi:hypothetical protein